MLGMTVLDFNTAKPVMPQISAEDIRARLHADPRRFVDWLYGGRALITKQEARIGNVQGEPGASLSITLAGPDAGLWHDHATGEGGDLIGLYMASMGYHQGANFQLALKEIAAEFLGERITIERTATWQKTAQERIDEKKHTLGTKPRADMLELGAPVATFRYYDTRGNVIASVVRYEPDGTRENKTFRPYCFRKIEGRDKWMPGAPELRPLYRLPEITLSPTVVLTEGEGKADALVRLGIETTTAMQGANTPIEKTDWSPLRGKTIIVWPDNDEPGIDYGRRVAAHLASIGCQVKVVSIPADKPPKWDAADCIAEGSDPWPLISSAIPVEKSRSRIRLFRLSDFETLPPLSWLVDGILTEGGLSMIWGRSGSLKSFVALDMAMSIATALPWHGRAVKPGSVVYIAAEGAFGLAQRALGWQKNRGAERPLPDLFLIPQSIAMVGPELDELIAAIPGKPAFIVIDTMSRTFGAANPNQPAEMNAYVDACDRLRNTVGSHVLVVHHAGEDESRNEIGNKGLRNACDTVIYVKRHSTKIQLINEAPKGKQKDAEEFKTITLIPKKMFYSVSGSTEERSTLLLNIDDAEPDASEEAKEPARQRLGKVESSIVAALKKAKAPLGAMAIASTIKANKGTVSTSLSSLLDKGLVERIEPDEEFTNPRWALL